MAVLKTNYRESTKRNMPKRWFDDLPHTHIALSDAIEQGAPAAGRHSKGCGSGVALLDGGSSGRPTFGCSPVSVFRNATTSATSCVV